MHLPPTSFKTIIKYGTINVAQCPSVPDDGTAQELEPR